jgi:hypothetical protein
VQYQIDQQKEKIMKRPLMRKEHLGLTNGQRDLPQDFRAEAERRLQVAQSGTLNASIATAYALLAIHDTLIKIEDHLISGMRKIEDHLISGMGRETQAPPPAVDLLPGAA